MKNDSKGIRVVVINGSVRPGNYTSMASALVGDELKKQPKVTVHLINPAEYHLPFPGTNPNAEGDATALYLIEALKPFEHIKITRIARGVPLGTQIEYIDQATLQSALEGRTVV